nr:recombinase family protein [Marinobacterium sp. xm-a-152]
MGGIPPLGYDVKDRHLVPNPKEAKLVKQIFTRFVELGSATLLVRELQLESATSKSWTTQDGNYRAGKPIDKGMIYKYLHNQTYIGKIHHKDKWYDGRHMPIITQEEWDAVHAILATNGKVRANRTRAKVPFLLKGIVFGSDGHTLTPWQTTKKNGKRYRYYIPQRDVKEYAGASGLARYPAVQLETTVVSQLREILRSPPMLERIIPQGVVLDNDLDEAKVTVAMVQLDGIWDHLLPAEHERITKLLVEKVVVSPDDIEVRMRLNGLETVTRELMSAQRNYDSGASI